MDDRAGRVGGDGDAVYLVQNGADGADVLLECGHDGWRVRKNMDALRGRDSEKRRHGSRKDEGGTIDALVLGDNAGACAEPTSIAERVGQ